jgi:hypothetical protein
MKKPAFAIFTIFMIALVMFFACGEKQTTDPCGRLVTLNVENKLGFTIFATVKETHDTATISRDYIFPFKLAGKQSYTLSINGPNYYKDSVMSLSCNDTLFIAK